MSFNPFHQFEVFPIIKLSIAGNDISFTNSSLFMVAAVSIIVAFFYFATRRASLIPGAMQGAAETIFQFVDSTLFESAGHKGKPFFPFILTLFTFITTLNLLGMMPYGFTVTSHVIVTFAMATLVFITVLLIGFIKHGLHFLSLFLPQGTPYGLPLYYLL